MKIQISSDNGCPRWKFHWSFISCTGSSNSTNMRTVSRKIRQIARIKPDEAKKIPKPSFVLLPLKSEIDRRFIPVTFSYAITTVDSVSKNCRSCIIPVSVLNIGFLDILLLDDGQVCPASVRLFLSCGSETPALRAESVPTLSAFRYQCASSANGAWCGDRVSCTEVGRWISGSRGQLIEQTPSLTRWIGFQTRTRHARRSAASGYSVLRRRS